MIKIKENEKIDLKLNTLYNCNCLDLLNNIPDNYVDLIVTDPPYLMNYKTNRRKNKNHEFCSVIQNDTGEEAEQLLKKVIKESYRVLKENTAMYMFCNSNKVEFFKIELQKYFNIKNMIIWVKNNHTAGDLECAFSKRYEIIFLVNKGTKPYNGKRLEDVWYFEAVKGNYQVHQNEKPVPLLMQCIKSHSNKNDIVLDLFAGSGNTATACQDTYRQFIISEIEEKYCQIIEDRINNPLL
ncbi:MAG: site-specific DNA-methyltransferase [Methanothrix sp.]|jgi:site-specific DNA-methyltransferase (adenine-specific)|nr:site-specific DNA-methyltransferase [Methanothrix sp.]